MGELIEDCSKRGKTSLNPTLISLGLTFLTTYNKSTLIENFIHYSYEYWGQIQNREEKFFRDNCANLFPDLPIKHVNAFKELFNDEEDIITDDDKNSIWGYFESLIRIGIKYIHRERGPKIRDVGEGPQRVYSRKEFPKIDLPKHANIWKVELKW